METPNRTYTSTIADHFLSVLQAISNLRAMLSQANDDQGIVGTTPGSVNLVR